MAIAIQTSLRFGASQNWFRIRVFVLYTGLCLNRFLLYTSLHSYLEILQVCCKSAWNPIVSFIFLPKQSK